jgi:IS5 family transposase
MKMDTVVRTKKWKREKEGSVPMSATTELEHHTTEIANMVMFKIGSLPNDVHGTKQYESLEQVVHMTSSFIIFQDLGPWIRFDFD